MQRGRCVDAKVRAGEGEDLVVVCSPEEGRGSGATTTLIGAGPRSLDA